VNFVTCRAEEMTFRFPSVVNDKSWKFIGRVPRVPEPVVVNHNATELTQQIMAGDHPPPPPETAEKPAAALAELTAKVSAATIGA
jgi:hypothetical protein